MVPQKVIPYGKSIRIVVVKTYTQRDVGVVVEHTSKPTKSVRSCTHHDRYHQIKCKGLSDK